MKRRFQDIGSFALRPIVAVVFLLLIFTVLTLEVRSQETMSVEEWLDKGWFYYNQGKKDDAFNTFLLTVSLFPNNAEAHLVLGQMYLEKGIVDLGRNEILRSLAIDDTTPLAGRAHYELAMSLREEDPAQALLHLQRAIELGGTIAQQLETAHQMRFCSLLIQMSGRSQSGPIVLHYAPYLIGRTEADTLAGKIDGSLYVAESYCSFDLIEPIHFFLYPSERAVRAEIMFETDDRDPKHREFHIVYAPDFDLAPELCTQIVFDLQEKLNRHAGAHWVDIALPVAVTGRLPIASAGRTVDIDCDDAVRALVASSGLVKLDYLRNDELSEYVSEEVRNAELGSFLRWVHAHYSIDEFQQVITQPNIDLILNSDTEQLESDWLQSLQEGNSLISDPRRAAEWAAGIPASPLLAGVQLPLDMLKEGIRLYLGGEEIMGKRQILHAIEIDPGMGLGYYTLGWIACRENNWDEAKQQLTMALMLLESPEEIAWCHAYLVPIYIRESRWDLAQASLAIVATTIRSPGVRQWAQSLLTRISHLMSLQPTQPVDRASQTFDQMRRFMLAWNQAANSRDGVASLISPLMDQVRAGELTSFYKSIRDRCPGVMFNHALQTVGTSGSALLIEVRIQAAMPEGSPDLPPGVETIKEEGYVRYFQLIPVGEGWQVQDWEDATFPSASAGFLMGTNLQIEGLEPGAGTGNP